MKFSKTGAWLVGLYIFLSAISMISGYFFVKDGHGKLILLALPVLHMFPVSQAFFYFTGTNPLFGMSALPLYALMMLSMCLVLYLAGWAVDKLRSKLP
jgi:hypothetical protein